MLTDRDKVFEKLEFDIGSRKNRLESQQSSQPRVEINNVEEIFTSSHPEVKLQIENSVFMEEESKSNVRNSDLNFIQSPPQVTEANGVEREPVLDT